MKFIRFFVNWAPEQQSDINTIIHVTGSYSTTVPCLDANYAMRTMTRAFVQLKQQCLFKMLKTTQ